MSNRGDSSSISEPLSVAYYCTGHGLGHATRAIEICKHLVARGHSVYMVSGAPARFFLQQLISPRFMVRKAVLDSGSKQLDPFTVDMKGSLEDYHRTCVAHRSTLLNSEVAWLKANQVGLRRVVRRAGIYISIYIHAPML